MTGLRRAAQWGAWVIAGVLLLVLYRSQALAGTGPQRIAYLVSVLARAATAGLLAWPDRHPRPRQALGRPASTKAALVARALQDALIDLDDL